MYKTRAIVGRQMGGCTLVTGRLLGGNQLAQRSFQAELLKRLSKIEAKLTRIEAQIAQRNQEK